MRSIESIDNRMLQIVSLDEACTRSAVCVETARRLAVALSWLPWVTIEPDGFAGTINVVYYHTPHAIFLCVDGSGCVTLRWIGPKNYRGVRCFTVWASCNLGRIWNVGS